MMKMRCKFWLGILMGIFLVGSVLAVSDRAVFQGQYFEGTEFQEGTFDFDFIVYDDETAGTSCFSDSKTLTTGFWGQWRTELVGISTSCNDVTKDYFMEIIIDNSTQSPRRRLTHFNYLRKNINETTTGDLTISNILNFIFGGFIQEFVDRFVFSKNLDVHGDLDVDGNVNITGETTINGEVNIVGETKIQGQLVCLENGTNCDDGDGGGSVGNYVSFISTIDGNLSISDRYLPLGTDSLIASSEVESSWIIDRNLTITGILWNSLSNTRTKNSVITLMKSTSDKTSFIETDLSKNIQGQVNGIDNSFEASFVQGDLAVIKYESGGVGGTIHDLSVTLIGIYD